MMTTEMSMARKTTTMRKKTQMINIKKTFLTNRMLLECKSLLKRVLIQSQDSRQ